jgi:hypothetical protein
MSSQREQGSGYPLLALRARALGRTRRRHVRQGQTLLLPIFSVERGSTGRKRCAPAIIQRVAAPESRRKDSLPEY